MSPAAAPPPLITADFLTRLAQLLSQQCVERLGPALAVCVIEKRGGAVDRMKRHIGGKRCEPQRRYLRARGKSGGHSIP